MGVVKGRGFFEKLLSAFFDFNRVRHAESRVLPEAAFRAILKRERLRSDRTHSPFSVVVFEVGRTGFGGRSANEIGACLVRRVRSTDDVGWLDGRMSVFLPDTAGAGAWKVAEDACRLLGESDPQRFCTVFSYPILASLETIFEAPPAKVLGVRKARSRIWSR